MTTSVTSTTTAPTVKTGNATDVSNQMSGTFGLSLAETVTTKTQPLIDQATGVQTQITTNGSIIGAYQNMQSLLSDLQATAANMTTEPLAGTNVFNNRTATLSSSSTTAASTLMSVNVNANTSMGTHTVVVNQVASSEAMASANQPVSGSTALNMAGTFTLGESGKTQVAITINASMTISNVAAAINGASSRTGITATVVAVDSTHSTLVLAGLNTNKPLNFSDDDGVLAGLGLLSTTATGGKVTLADSSTVAVNTAGSFTITGGTAPVDVTLTADMTMDGIAQAINDASAAVGSSTNASVVANSDGTFSLKVSSQDTNGNGVGGVSFTGVTGTALDDLGLKQSGAVKQITAAGAAKLTVDGVDGITRDTNQVNDVLKGVTLNLLQADKNTTLTVGVVNDPTTVTAAINSFVSAYNAWENFVKTNETTDSSGKASSSAILFGNSTLRDASLQVDTALTALVSGNSLAGLGITLDNNNQLVIDQTTLSNQLASNFDGAKTLFGSFATADSPTLQQYGSNYSTFAGNLTFDITTDGDGVVQSAVLNGTDSTSFRISGNIISGNAGTPYSGLSFTYAGTGGTVNVTSTQGLASQLYQITKKFADQNSGTVQNLVNNLQDQDQTMTTQYNAIVARANDYANYLVQQYGQLSSQMNAAGQTKNVIEQLMAYDTKG